MSLTLPMLHDRGRVNLVEPGRLHPAVSFARASTATYMGPGGVLKTAAVNQPRYAYDATGNYIGWLTEEARTNALLNSTTLVTQSVTVTAAAQTLSFYGTGTVTLSGTFSGLLVGTGASNRVTLTFTPTAGSLTLTVTGSVTNAQIESGAFATSYIPTTSSAVTRAADVARITNPAAIGWAGGKMSLMVDVQTLGTVINTTSRIFGVWDGTTLNRVLLYVTTGSTGIPNLLVSSGGVTQANLTKGALSATSRTKVALAMDTNNFALTTAGAAPSTAVAAALPTGLTTIGIGNDPSGGTFCGYINSMTMYPNVRRANAELQSLTA